MTTHLERLYDDVFLHRAGHICSYCGYFGKQSEMVDDPDLGWLHYKCLGQFRKTEKQEQIFEWAMEQAKAEKGRQNEGNDS